MAKLRRVDRRETQKQEKVQPVSQPNISCTIFMIKTKKNISKEDMQEILKIRMELISLNYKHLIPPSSHTAAWSTENDCVLLILKTILSCLDPLPFYSEKINCTRTKSIYLIDLDFPRNILKKLVNLFDLVMIKSTKMIVLPTSLQFLYSLVVIGDLQLEVLRRLND